MLREAFAKTLSDPDLLADIKKKKLEVDPTPGDELEVLAKEVTTSNREVIERMKNLLGKAVIPGSRVTGSSRFPAGLV